MRNKNMDYVKEIICDIGFFLLFINIVKKIKKYYFRGYCSRKIRRLRKSSDFTNFHKSFPKRSAKFIRRIINVETLTNSRFVFNFKIFNLNYKFRILEIILFETERNWAYSMYLTMEFGDGLHSRKRFHMRRKLRRTAKWSLNLEKLVKESELVSFI